jgi:hypothetical protein
LLNYITNSHTLDEIEWLVWLAKGFLATAMALEAWTAIENTKQKKAAMRLEIKLQ